MIAVLRYTRNCGVRSELSATRALYRGLALGSMTQMAFHCDVTGGGDDPGGVKGGRKTIEIVSKRWGTRA